ncbi:MAG TPA: GAF domain-containing protein [Gemmatimonadaceae bacterium]
MYAETVPPLDFFAKASRMLADSFLEATVKTAVELALPVLGTWCMVDVIDSDGSIRRSVIIHPNANQQKQAQSYYFSHPPAPGDLFGAGRMATSKDSLYVESDVLGRISGREHRDLLDNLGAQSLLVIVMRPAGQMLGALTFGSEQRREYDVADRVLAEDLGNRCATLVESARNYGENQITRLRAEHAFAMENAARTERAYAAGRGAIHAYRLGH